LKDVAQVEVVAPEQNNSAKSNALTLHTPMYVCRASNGFRYINGTPADCVHIALTGLLGYRPDLVLAGINNGANMGDDTIYSGTVAAATEGYLLGIPSFAISMSQHQALHFETAAKIVVDVVQQYNHSEFTEPTLLNINVPDVPFEAIKGKKITRLGKRHKAEPVIQLQTPRGETVYWVGAAGQPNDGGEGTDFHAVAEGYVSISPIQVDLTKHSQIATLQQWLQSKQ
jgi:5'-nucleotidase